ncbi:MAG: tetratricopeptide repeat protein [Sulfuricellaceae bacterium]
MNAPVQDETLNRLAALFSAGQFAEMESLARWLLERRPNSGLAWKGLGVSLQMQGKEALPALRKTAELLPDDAAAHYNLGNALQRLGQLDGAVVSYRRTLEIKPDYFAAHGNLGVVLQDLGQLDGAVASFRRALEINPDFADAHSNLGHALQELGQPDRAAASCRRALEIKPDYAEAHYNLGNALKEQGQFAEAAASYAQALEIQPGFAEAHNNLGIVQQDLGQLDGALASYVQALQIQPNYADARSNLLFALNYHPDKPGEEIYAAYREYDERFGLPLRGKWRAHSNSRDIHRRLKVGYVSPDFRRHSCRHFLEPLLAHHDKNAVEVYAYAELAREDEVTARYKGYADHWMPTLGMADDALSDRIRADGIDILVDLAGHTAKNRLAVFVRKPAPVSLSWLGFGYTTGLTAVDYLLTDATCAPEGSEALFSETPWRLETPGYAYRPEKGMGEVSALPALTRGYVTFGALTRAVRINPRTIRVWSALLKRVEGARLAINSRDYRDATMQDALAEKFAAHGISRERLEIGFHTPPWDVLRGLDIGLDCFPHNSGTTLFETLYMGVPFVTLAGRPSVGRLGSSILEGVGHPSLIARSEEEYIDIAVALASDLPKLVHLRAGLRQTMETSPLMDEAGFARKVETAYREMFGKWARG